MKKMFRILLVVMLAFVLTACGNEKVKEDQNDKEDVTKEDVASEAEKDEDETEKDADLSGEIIITGSTSVASIVEEMKNEFEAINPGVTVNYQGTGSSAGVSDTIEENNDLGVASRNIKDEEYEAGVTNEIFSWDGIAVIVHPDNEVSELTMEQILDIYSGEITNWSDVGGSDNPINVMAREAASGTRGAFEEITGLEDVGMKDDASEFSSNGSLQIAVSEDENAIGYVSFTYIDDTIKALAVDGGEPTTDNVLSEVYPLARPFNVVMNEDNYSDLAKAFVEFMLSAEGQEIVEAEGGIPIG